ncbi:MAG TPA: 50S ribosomal protein L9 [Gammaproteobacteria bacterium]|jgi:large subunit ribosomal protein L9|nr:50S ribosomal protein L9 [Gammaproteobacteria bacterium]
MQVILLEKIRNLGGLGDSVKVASGFARNFLFPKGKAVRATDANLEQFKQRRAELEKLAEQRREAATARQQLINAMGPVTVLAKAGEEGKLFGSIGIRDISQAICDAGVKVEKREVRLPAGGSLRMLGEYDVIVELDGDISATIKVIIAPQS